MPSSVTNQTSGDHPTLGELLATVAVAVGLAVAIVPAARAAAVSAPTVSADRAGTGYGSPTSLP